MQEQTKWDKDIIERIKEAIFLYLVLNFLVLINFQTQLLTFEVEKLITVCSNKLLLAFITLAFMQMTLTVAVNLDFQAIFGYGLLFLYIFSCSMPYCQEFSVLHCITDLTNITNFQTCISLHFQFCFQKCRCAFYGLQVWDQISAWCENVKLYY